MVNPGGTAFLVVSDCVNFEPTQMLPPDMQNASAVAGKAFFDEVNPYVVLVESDVDFNGETHGDNVSRGGSEGAEGLLLDLRSAVGASVISHMYSTCTFVELLSRSGVSSPTAMSVAKVPVDRLEKCAPGCYGVRIRFFHHTAPTPATLPSALSRLII